MGWEFTWWGCMTQQLLPVQNIFHLHNLICKSLCVLVADVIWNWYFHCHFVPLLCCDTVVLWHCRVVTLLCCDTVVLWHCRVVTLSCCDTVVLWQCCVVTLLCCDTVVLWHCCVVTLLWQMSDIIYYTIMLPTVLQLPRVFSTVTCCTGLQPMSNRLYHIAHLRQECHNSKFGIFELLVQKETF
jgi:hypothetical protein